ncbi:hypothetical protein V8C37DRAFT_105360 [Trichoderma ceciliae]
MASPNAIFPSPSRSVGQKSHLFRSSSPDLPAIKDIISRDAKPRQSEHGDRAWVISSDEETAIKLTGNKERVKPLSVAPTPSVSNNYGTAEADDSSLCIIDPLTTHSPEVQRNQAAPSKFSAQSSSPAKDQSRKRFQSKKVGSKNEVTEARVTETEDTGPMSAQQTVGDSSSVGRIKSKRGENDISEPLRLEPAMVRRLDWTPPSNKTTAIPKPNSSALRYERSPREPSGAIESFEQVLEAYKCTDSLQQRDVSMPSDEDTNVLRKRKLVELVITTTVPIGLSAEVKDKPSIKQKAPKKRPRTITELATSAYRAPDPLESASIVIDDSATTSANKESDDPTSKGELKAKPRKKTAKAAPKKKKKPSPPPRPILLPPAEALQEVARQDFVFGTSSQLAIENSPTFLRDLQAAMRRSNQVEYIDLDDTPLNSDTIEPPERKRLWAAGARDVDGDLFDFQMSKIMESSQLLPALSAADDDPFGYVGRDKKTTLSTAGAIEVNTTLQDNSFVDTADVLCSKGGEPTELFNDDFVLMGNDISIDLPVQRRIKLSGGGQSMEVHGPHDDGNSNQARPHDSKPSFELLTDTQLSKEIASYGFKAVKSRQAKIALLEQCWQGKSHREQPGSRKTVVTSATTGEGASKSPVKTPRGRPRKKSASTPEAQEPPPSAQPPVSPSKPRGRPKKTATVTKPSTARPLKEKKASSKTSAEASTVRKRKPKATQATVEIPDSASDSDRSLSPDPVSSPSSTFSQPPVDLSLSIMDETDPSLSLNSTEDRSLSFEYITKAVKSAPRATDPTNPSWHEKILLYDPIVVEDLTTWLNCGQLTRVGFDGEVNTMEVKQWCESKSICCLWKVNLRGKERKRF